MGYDLISVVRVCLEFPSQKNMASWWKAVIRPANRVREFSLYFVTEFRAIIHSGSLAPCFSKHAFAGVILEATILEASERSATR
jgi:hypothetical protein